MSKIRKKIPKRHYTRETKEKNEVQTEEGVCLNFWLSLFAQVFRSGVGRVLFVRGR